MSLATFEDGLTRVTAVLRLEREFRALADPRQNLDARNAHVELALQTLEELLKQGQTRFERDLLDQVGRLLQSPEKIEAVGDGVDKRFKYMGGRGPIAPVAYQHEDLVVCGIALGVYDDVVARVVRILQEFSPSY